MNKNLLYGKNSSKRNFVPIEFCVKEKFFVKKMSFAIIAAAVLIAVVFAACNGADSGKVSDPAHNDPILTTLEDMMTEAATDIENMFTDNASDNVTDGFDNNSDSQSNIVTQ